MWQGSSGTGYWWWCHVLQLWVRLQPGARKQRNEQQPYYGCREAGGHHCQGTQHELTGETAAYEKSPFEFYFEYD